ncbi:hypothetical protein IMZ29_19305 [Achromobacter sp. GG226]|nr:hypothetical protein [Verticiella sp. GG226]MBU4612612.1 hypothetical protein [Verticiella sp. GG226]
MSASLSYSSRARRASVLAYSASARVAVVLPLVAGLWAVVAWAWGSGA